MKKVVILGAGGHARVLADLISLLPDHELRGFLDDQLAAGTPVSGICSVLGKIADIDQFDTSEHYFVAGIGNNEIRKHLSEKNTSVNWITLVHPAAVVAPSASIGRGSVVLAGAIIASNTVIGEQCIVNSGVVVDHDCIIQNFIHLKTGSIIGSNSKIDDLFSTEIGSKIEAFTTLQ